MTDTSQDGIEGKAAQGPSPSAPAPLSDPCPGRGNPSPTPPAEGAHGIVLAGAFRWGDSPFESLGARPALPVALVPLVCHVVRWLHECGLPRATLCTNGASARDVRRSIALGSFAGMDIDHVDDWTPRGAAGCMRDAARDSSAGTLLVCDGTLVPVIDAADLIAQHRRTKAAATVVVSRDRGVSETGRLLAPIGIYAFDRRVLAHVPEIGYQDIKETLIRKLHLAGEAVVPYVADEVCPRPTGARSFLAANAWVAERMIAEPWVREGFRKIDGGLIHATAQVDPAATLVAPFLIGPGARVAAGAVIVGPATLGEGSSVAEGALCARSVLMSGASLEAKATVDRCVVAEGARAPAGAYLYEAVIPGAGAHRETPARQPSSGAHRREARAYTERRA